MRNFKCFARVHKQCSHIDIEHNTILTIPAILYANFNGQDITPEITEHLQAEAPYLTAFPDSTINQLVVMTITGLNQRDSVVNNIANTMFAVYQRLHILVEEEIAHKIELLRLEWIHRIRDSWEVAKAKYFWPDEYGWIQYQDGPTVQGMKEQYERERWEIYRRSNTLWEEKEMLWIRSLGELQRMMLRFPSTSPLNSGYLNDEFSDSSNGVTSNMEGQCNSL
jgi:hypothetical protein